MNPELRFKEQDGNDFPDWEEKKIKEIGRVTMCKRIFKDQTLAWGEIPFFKIGTFGDIPDAYITRELFEDFKKKYPYPQKGNILISASGSIGKLVEYNGEDAYFQDSNIIWLEHKNDVLDKYLKQIYPTLNWEEGLEGSTIKRLYNKVFLNKVIFLPQVLEQSKIAALLSDIDKKIESQAILVEKLKNTKDAMFVKMFLQGDSKTPEIRFDRFSGDWKEKKLGEICETITDGAHNSPKEVSNSRGYYMPSVKDMTNNGFDFSECKQISEYDFEMLRRQGCMPKVGDILVSKDGSILSFCFSVKEEANYVILSSIAIIRPKQEINSLFLEQYFKRDCFKKLTINQYSKGNALKRIILKDFKTIKIQIPPTIQEQEKIGQFFSNLDKEIEINQQKYEKLCDVKKALLSKLFPTKEDE